MLIHVNCGVHLLVEMVYNDQLAYQRMCYLGEVVMEIGDHPHQASAGHSSCSRRIPLDGHSSCTITEVHSRVDGSCTQDLVGHHLR